MRIGTFIMGTRGGDYEAMLEQVVRCEELGFDTVVLAERHFRHAPLLYPSPLAGRRRDRRAHRADPNRHGGPHPLPRPPDPHRRGRRDPRRAQRAAGSTSASPGRASTRRLTSPSPRPHEESQGRFLEALEIIVRAWTEDSFSFEGEHFSIPEVSVFPKPVQRPHPPSVRGRGLARAARVRLPREGINAYIGAIRTPGGARRDRRHLPARPGRGGPRPGRADAVGEPLHLRLRRRRAGPGRVRAAVPGADARARART